MYSITEQDIIDMTANIFGQYAVIPNTQFTSPSLMFSPSLMAGIPKQLTDHADMLYRCDNIKRLAKHLRFTRQYAWKSDADLWATLEKDLNEFEQVLGESTEALHKINAQEMIERTKFVTHMLNGFKNGERFIVAKLSYNGGEA
jgi:hypothetical protein